MAKLLYPKGTWNGKIVALDDGHGMQTPGKRTPYVPELGREIHENEFNRKAIGFLVDILLAHGFKVLLVAPTDADTPLSYRTKAANQYNVDIYVSIHFNAMSYDFDYSNASGISVHIYNGWITDTTKHLAECVGKHLRKGTKQVYRGIKRNNFHVLREVSCPSILTENGFMDDRREALLMLDEDFQKEVAVEHARGICEYFGIPYQGAEVATVNYFSEGDKGSKVKDLQTDLLELGYDMNGYGADGSYGPATVSAVKSFQRDQGLLQDGIFGPDTQKAIKKALSEQKEDIEVAENKKATGYTDVREDHYAAGDIKKAAERGMIKGRPDGSYAPERYLTRADAAIVANRTYEKAFADAVEHFEKTSN